MKVREILSRNVREGNLGPADDMSIEGPFDISTPNGEQEEDDEDYSQEADDEPELCGQCNGSGEGMYDGSRCGTCRGSGVIQHREEEDPDDQRDRMRDAEWDGSGPDKGGWDSDE